MVINLKKQLDRFEEKIKAKPQQYQVTQTEDYRGGAVNLWVLVLLACSGIFRNKVRTKYL